MSIKRVVMLLTAMGIYIVGASGHQGAPWSGKVEIKDGITVIRNPQDPLYGEITFELEEDLSIGKDSDDNYLFQGDLSLAVDAWGKVYALDGRARRIQKYDETGRFIQTIGRKGQGPGEFEFPLDFFIDARGNIYVNDRREIKKFDNKGVFSNSYPVAGFINDFYVNPEGNVFAFMDLTIGQGSKQVVVAIDQEGKTSRTIAEFPYPDLIFRKSGEAMLSFGVSRHRYVPGLCFTPVGLETFCYAHSSTYEIAVLDGAGSVLSRIQKEESAKTVTQKEKDEILGQMERRFKERGRPLPPGVLDEVRFPPNRPFFDGLMADDEGRIYARKLKPVLESRKGFEFDIFGKSGIYLYRTILPFSPRLISRGLAYDVALNDDTGEIKIVRYRITNWAKIRTS
jgi:hypothetical protein